MDYLQMAFAISQPVQEITENAEYVGSIKTGYICVINVYKEKGKFVRMVKEVN